MTSGLYVPKQQRTPEQWQAYLLSNRERNRRYYQRKRDNKKATQALRRDAIIRGVVRCQCKCGCDLDIVPVCEECKKELFSGENIKYWP